MKIMIILIGMILWLRIGVYVVTPKPVVIPKIKITKVLN